MDEVCAQKPLLLLHSLYAARYPPRFPPRQAQTGATTGTWVLLLYDLIQDPLLSGDAGGAHASLDHWIHNWVPDIRPDSLFHPPLESQGRLLPQNDEAVPHATPLQEGRGRLRDK